MAHTVAKSFTQILDEDYNEIYVSVAILESVWLICAIAPAQGLHLQQIDFILALLNSDNKFEIYMKQPKGFKEGGEKYVQKLLKTSYRTMQRVYDWAENLDYTYKGHGYYKS